MYLSKVMVSARNNVSTASDKRFHIRLQQSKMDETNINTTSGPNHKFTARATICQLTQTMYAHFQAIETVTKTHVHHFHIAEQKFQFWYIF